MRAERRTALELAQDLDTAELSDAFDTSGLDAWDWGTAGIIMAASFVLAPITRRVVMSIFERTGTDHLVAQLIGRLAAYLTVVVGLVYALEELGVAIGPVLGALGIAGIAIAFALQDILTNFVSGVIIQIRRPFTTGDEIASGDHVGTVLSVDGRTVTIRTLDGEIVQLPSSLVVNDPLVNYTAEGARRTTLDVGVAYDTDLATAERVIAGAAAGVEFVRDDPAPQALVQEFGDNSINFALRFWHDPSIGDEWRVRHAVALAVKRDLDAAGITIPFPQRTLWWGSDDAE